MEYYTEMRGVSIGLGWGMALVAIAPSMTFFMMLVLGYFHRDKTKAPLLDPKCDEHLWAAFGLSVLFGVTTSIGLGVFTTWLHRAFLIYKVLDPS
jgi:hypothetical protein